MLLLQRKCESIDDTAENLEELGNTVVSLSVVHELEEDVIDRPSDESPEI